MTQILQKLQAFQSALVVNLLPLQLATVTKATCSKSGELWKTTANAFSKRMNYGDHIKELIQNIHV